ncbi:hypothetical protein NBRC116583_05600 [Arenicella sp. 4NH20-0111]|uniref:hypothetical protein n=1 Tax=Arenicella sp. 4NH20-0111 TaxID=3127648 RepID=UPI003104FCA8
MVNISNLSSVFEVTFAMNAIFYIFSYAPFIEKNIEQKLKLYGETVNDAKKANIKVNTTYTYWSSRDLIQDLNGLLGPYSILCSLVSLVLLIVSGFNTELSMPNILAYILLFLLIVPVPAMSFNLHRIINAKIHQSTEEIEKRIEEKRGSANIEN